MLSLVSIVIPTYKRAHALEEAISSVKSQTYTHWELIIVDDNCPQSEERKSTENVMSQFQHEEKIKYVKHDSNQGACQARNTGLQQANGKYIAFLDDDDIWLENKLERQVKQLDKSGSALCYSDMNLEYQGRKKYFKCISSNSLFDKLLNQGFGICTSAFLITKESLLAINGFDDSLPSMQDYDLLLRLAERFECDYIPEALLTYQLAEDGISCNPTNKANGHRAIISKYEGKFDEGWEALRTMTFAKQKELGWIPQDAVLNPLASTQQKWDEIPTSQREFQSRLMEIYAGFLEHTDVQYGKIVDELERQGQLENTLIIYINSDNGPSSEGMNGTISELLAQNSMPSTIEEHIEVLHKDYGGMDALGGPKLDIMYHHGWAYTGSSPFQGTKLVAAHLGGTRTPMVISWPAKIKHDEMPRSQFHHVNDIAATLYDILDITPPKVVNGIEQQPLDGVSMAYTFDQPEAKSNKKTQYFEILGSRGVYHEGWFAGTPGPKPPWSTDPTGIINWEPEKEVWELYNLEEDYAQSNDIASDNPEKLAELKDIFDREATDNLVYPIGASMYTVFFHPEELPSSPLKEWSFYEGQNRIPEAMAPKFLSGRSTSAVIDAEITEGAEGVFFAVGGISSGFTVYMDQGVLKAEYNAMTLNRYKIRSKSAIPTGKVKIEVVTKYDTKERMAPATITLKVNGKEVGQGRIERSVPSIHTASETFDVGADLGSPVALDYFDRAPFKFNGKIEKINIKYID